MGSKTTSLDLKKILRVDLAKAVKKPKVKKAALICGISLFSLGLIVFVFNYAYRDKIFPQTYIGGVNLGGQTKSQAQATLESYNSEAKKDQIELKYLNDNWVIKTSDLNVNLKPSDSVDLAWKIGREGNFGEILLEQIKAVFGGNSRLAVFSYNQGNLNEEILKIAAKTDIAEKDATIKIADLQASIVPEEIGRKLDFMNTKQDILNTIGSFKNSTVIDLKVDQVKPKVTSANTEAALTQTKNILLGQVTLKSTNKNYILNPSDFSPWLIFNAVSPDKTSSGKIDLTRADSTKKSDDSSWVLEVNVDEAKIAEYLGAIAGEINADPKDAKFSVADGQVTTFQASQTGYKLDVDKSKALITSAILNQTKEITLSVTVTNPTVASNSATDMGIKEMVGDGKTSWRGSPSNRIHNLTLGANNISGTIVKPGEEFSTVKAIGPIDGEHGFLQELVIKNSTQVVPDFGGGLCQVSTTLFRAALNAGLKITARTNHSFRVSYYEPPVGMDATIYDPAPDFKFVNTYSTPILIWGIAGNNGLEFQIFGTKDGRVVNISTPVISSYIDSPPDNYQESATMDPGTVRQVEKALKGCIASFYYSVVDSSGKTLEKQTFVSKYVALANSYLYGAGFVPPGQ